MKSQSNAISVVPKMVVAVASLFLLAGNASAQKRVWTAKSGHQAIATLIDQTEDAVSLRIKGRPRAVVVMKKLLIEADLEFARKQMKKQPAIFINKPGARAKLMERPLFAEQAHRRQERRIYAMEERRAYNANKGPAVYQRGSMPNPMLPFGSGIQNGWVKQPPIPRPWIFVF